MEQELESKQFLEKKPRKFGDRRDGIWVKDAPGINIIMSCLYPNRADCEVCVQQTFDVTELLKYIERKNASGQEYTTKFFHCLIAMMVRVFNERRKLNRFVQTARMYERDEITVSFVAKQQMNDEATEALLTYRAKGTDTVDDVSRFVLGKVSEVRKESSKQKGITDTVNKFAKLPRFLLLPITGFIRFLDRWGKVPKCFTNGDPAYSSLLISNLGSIGSPSAYHHLNNYGTNSVMMTVGKIHKETHLCEDGTLVTSDVVDLSVTADERIADGFYLVKSLKLLDTYFAHPELLDSSFDTPLSKEEEE